MEASNSTLSSVNEGAETDNNNKDDMNNSDGDTSKPQEIADLPERKSLKETKRDYNKASSETEENDLGEIENAKDQLNEQECDKIKKSDQDLQEKTKCSDKLLSEDKKTTLDETQESATDKTLEIAEQDLQEDTNSSCTRSAATKEFPPDKTLETEIDLTLENADQDLHKNMKSDDKVSAGCKDFTTDISRETDQNENGSIEMGHKKLEQDGNQNSDPKKEMTHLESKISEESKTVPFSSDDSFISTDDQDGLEDDVDTDKLSESLLCTEPDDEVTSTVELSCQVTSTDHNNNCTNRAETVVTPDNEMRGISPEIFCMTHMSPTELYGKDHMIGAPRLLTQPRISHSRSESTLNTPDPVYLEDDDLDESFLNHNKGLKRRISEVDENENPVSYNAWGNLYQPNCTAVNSYRSDGRQLYKGTYPTMPMVSDQSFNYTSGQSVDNTGNSYTARRLDFGSSANVCSPTDFRSSVNLGSFYNVNQTFTSQAVPSFVSNSSFLPHNITRPMPVVPVMPSYSGYGYPQIDVNCNPCSQIQYSPFNPDTVFRSPLSLYYSQAASCSSYSSPLTVQQGSQQALYANTSQTFPDVPLDRSNSTAATVDRPDQQKLYTEFYRRVHQDDQSRNVSQTYSADGSCWQTDSSPKTYQCLDQANNNLYANKSKHSTTAVYGINTDSCHERSYTTNIDNSMERDVSDPRGVVYGSVNEENSEESESVKDRTELTDEESDTMSCDSDNLVSWKNRNATVPVALKTKDKTMFVSVKELGSKTVKHLMEIAEKNKEEKTYIPSQQNKLEYNEAFINRFKEERKTKSPMSAFCAALKPEKPEIRPNITAEPRIPIPALLYPNEVPMMYSGSMLVPYFQPPLISMANSGVVPRTVRANQTSLYTETSQLGLLGSYTLTSKTSVCVGGQVPETPLALAGQRNQTAPYTATLPFTASGQVPIAPHTEAGTQVAQTFSRPIAPASSQPRSRVPTYPSAIGQIPLIPPTVATPLYEKLPESYPSTRAWQASPGPAYNPLRIFSTPAPESKSSSTSLPISAAPDQRQPSGSYTSASAPQAMRRSSTPIQPAPHPGAHKKTPPGPHPGPHKRISPKPHPGPHKKPPSQQGRCWKAKHYSFTVLRIGTYEYKCDLTSQDKAARLKLLFRKRRVIYEYQVDGTDNSLDSRKTMAEIIVPFENIVGLWLNEREMKLEVSGAPMMFGGVRGMEKTQCGSHQSTVYNRKQKVDLTKGQLDTCPYHHLQFKTTTCPAKIREDFEQFDDKFRTMLQGRFVEKAGKTLHPPPLPVASYLLNPDVGPVTRTPADLTNKTCVTADSSSTEEPCEPTNMGGCCDCIEGCNSTSHCTCCALGVRCTKDRCSCLACRNPLNVLHNMGLPWDRAVKDPCLMDNIYQISRLDDYVKTQLTLDCCQGSTLLFSCIPGEVPCPNPGCGVRYKYSWCSALLCNEALSPRNHCEKCRRCTDYRDMHCQTCNICYFAGEHGSFKCAACHSFDDQYDTSTSDSG